MPQPQPRSLPAPHQKDTNLLPGYEIDSSLSLRAQHIPSPSFHTFLAHHCHSAFMFGISIPRLKVMNFSHSPTPVTHKSCVFCNITPENGFDVVWEACVYSSSGIKLNNNSFAIFQDETFIAFNDYKPAAQHHILVIPKSHVRMYSLPSNAGRCRYCR